MASAFGGVKRIVEAVGNALKAGSKTFDKAGRDKLLEEMAKRPKFKSSEHKLIEYAGKVDGESMFGAIGRHIRNTGLFAGNTLTYGVRVPFEWAGRGTARVIDGATWLYAKNPYLTTGAVAAAGGAYGLNEWQKGQRQDALQTQAQVQQAMMQSQYMNSVSPQEAALLESRFRSGGVSMAEMEDQRRMAAQGAPATNV